MANTFTTDEKTLLLERSEQQQLASRWESAATSERLIIVGNGMASFGLCDRLVRSGVVSGPRASGGPHQYQITVFGDEPQPAYDRVNLSKLFDGRTAEELLLASADWYRENGISLKTGSRIASIDRENKQVVDANGASYGYDKLVIATGSRAWLPPIPGSDAPAVFVYRTLDDLQNISRYIDQVSAKSGAVIGGGLLGLEAAKVLVDHDLETTVLEAAPGLMPRQLDNRAAAILKDRVEAMGVEVRLICRTQKIESLADSRLKLHFDDETPGTCDLLIVAAGVRPNDQLARDCDLSVGPRGGIAIDSKLHTSDPNIYAIGECASFNEHVFGLAAPCYRMADVLAEILSGQTSEFLGADESAELKLMGVQVAALGSAIGETPGVVSVTQQDEQGYRKLLLENGRLVGAACVGDWAELPQVRQAIAKKSRIWPTQRSRFERTGSPWNPGGAMTVMDWPGDSVVCSCHAVTKQTIVDTIKSGVTQPAGIAEKTGASSACGSCLSLVCELAGGQAEKTRVAGAATMLIASMVAAVLCVLLVTLPSISFATSVQDAWRNIDVLWRNDLARQITGYTVLGLTLLGLVFSLRKRFDWFRFGSYAFWRSVHGTLGALVLVAVAVHTGMRLGENLNFVLATVFLSTAALGAIAGIASSMEGRLVGRAAMMVRRWRPRLTKMHYLLFWPLPILIALHVLSFYWFSD